MKKSTIFIFGILVLVAASVVTPASVLAAEREVSFKTSDGWTIYGTLSTPENSNQKVPAVILLPSTEHDRAAFG
ncbi:MAG TPA: hypothetical protein VI750_14400, partial [Pyrinomonadaceae bacterium]|nr:hypothetical protein [Pyrinomonadaceae bacterium]